MDNNAYILRRKYLSQMLKEIFKYKAVDYTDTDEVNKAGTIILGCKTDPMDCRFTNHYKEKYVKIFEIAFSYDKCTIISGNKNKQTVLKMEQKDFIFNAIAFFKWNGIDIDYRFDNACENKLFSRLILKFIKKLLLTLFLHGDDGSSEKDALCEKEYTKTFKSIRNYVIKHEIIDMIYTDAKLTDVETCYDEKYEESECCDYFLYYLRPFYTDILAGLYICIPQKHYRIPRDMIRYGEDRTYKINYFSFDNKYLIKMVDESVRFNKPSFYCLKTNYSKIDEESDYDNKVDIWGDPVNIETKEHDIAVKRIIDLMPYYAPFKDESEIKKLLSYVEIIFQINYTDTYENKKIPKEFEKGFLSFKSIIKKSEIVADYEIPICFIILFSFWVNNVWRRLYSYVGTEGEKELKKNISKLDLRCIINAKEKYETFCSNNYNLIKKFKGLVYGIIDYGYEVVFADKKNRIYNPFSYLIKTIKVLLGDENEKWIY